ncbi:MAG: glutamate--cysteine ligase [Candidatus Omnitrophota bacterium]|jgi:glutamate--cysteine ligase
MTLERDKTLQRNDLRAYFKPKERTASQALRIGVELEKIALCKKSLNTIPMDGANSIQSLLRDFAQITDWQLILEGETIIGLKKDEDLISIEPGGQLELSCQESESIQDLYLQEQNHLDLLKRLSLGKEILWSGLGLQPLSAPASMEWLNKARYGLMSRYLITRGHLAHWMMKMTSSIQVSIDFKDELDAAKKVAVAAKWSPIFTAAFANSYISQGKVNDFHSYRSEIWQHTDPARCGLPECYFKKEFCINDYIEYALDTPMIFIQRANQTIPITNMNFKRFLDQGWEGEVATQEDWHTHLSLLFPEIRLKSFVEIRSFDRQNAQQTFLIPLLMKLCFYSNAALNQLQQLSTNWSHEDCNQALSQAAKLGLNGKLQDASLRDWFKELLQCARMGYVELNEKNELDAYERELYQQLIQLKESPSETALRQIQQGAPITQIIRNSEL